MQEQAMGSRQCDAPQTKYVFVTGGVASSLGKGIISASLGKLLQSRGYRVTIQKLDPYLNIDPGTLNPYEHGECYVTEDGAETDLDLGHYERFLNRPTSRANSVTTGQVYQQVIAQERSGAYGGKTVQVIPHVTDEIKRRILSMGETGDYDVVICEIGGTVGDIESLPYIEAVRQLRWNLGQHNSACVHLTLVPYLAASGELKTKPTQHSVKELLEEGIQPDVLVLRTEHHINEDMRAKVAQFCNVRPENVIESIDVKTIYEVPVRMLHEKLDERIIETLALAHKNEPNLSLWFDFLERFRNPENEVRIALVGKYVELPDAYKSINEALIHAGAANHCKVKVDSISAEDLENYPVDDLLKGYSAILVAPGFGERGIEGKIKAVCYARENDIPFLGICLGMQAACVEFARNVLNIEDASSSEWNPDSPHKIIDLMEDQTTVTDLGGTMRLGAYPCRILPGSMAYKAYGKEEISERHRHRYEFNNQFRDLFEKSGCSFAGLSPDGKLVEMIEIPLKKWFIGVQFHPEYKSTVLNPHPLFVGFVKAAMQYQA